MAYGDIQVHQTPPGGLRIEYHAMDAAEAFSKGDVVVLASTGEIQEALTTGPLSTGLLGIAMGGPTGPGGITLNDPRTDTTYATGAMIPVAIPTSDTLFRTKNFTTATTAFDDTAPLAANLGDAVGLVSISGVWGIDLQASPDSNELTCRLVGIEDNTGRPLQPKVGGTARTVSTGTIYWVIFQIIAHMGLPDSGEAVAPIGET